MYAEQKKNSQLLKMQGRIEAEQMSLVIHEVHVVMDLPNGGFLRSGEPSYQ